MGAPAALQIILIPAIHSLPPPISASPCRPASACCLPFFATSICALHVASPRLPRCPLSSAPGGCPSLTATKGLCRLLCVPAFTCKEAAICRAELVGKHFFSYFHMCWCLGLLQPETSPLRIQSPRQRLLGQQQGPAPLQLELAERKQSPSRGHLGLASSRAQSCSWYLIHQPRKGQYRCVSAARGSRFSLSPPQAFCCFSTLFICRA